MKIGFKGIRAEAEEALSGLDEFSAVDTLEKRPFLEAVILTADAIILWAHRHGKAAQEKAEQEKDPVRKAELLEIFRICYKVPENPAETFHEAVQSQWFIQLFSRIEQKTGIVISNGRMRPTS